MGKVVRFQKPPDQRPACRWAELHGMQGTMRVAEHAGLTVLLFVDDATGKTYVIGEKVDG